MSKLKSLTVLGKICLKLRKQRKAIVFTNGCFDLIHPGHLKILKKSKQKGDILVVGLNSDVSVKKIKGPARPILNQKARAQILSELEIVDYIVLFSQKTPYQTIKKLKPDILVKGGDWKEDQIIGRDMVKKIYRIKLAPGFSTTALIKKIKKSA